MVEITSPGKLPPSVDFNDIEARQSEIRNRVIAPFFKHLGLIDQWGNGLKLIADELHEYSDIELKWQESGLQFQLQFIKKNFVKETEQNLGLAERLAEGLVESQKAILRMVEKQPTISKKRWQLLLE